METRLNVPVFALCSLGLPLALFCTDPAPPPQTERPATNRDFSDLLEFNDGLNAATPPLGGRRLWRDLPADGERIAYAGRNPEQERFARIQSIELETMRVNLKQRFQLDFKTRATKYYRIAYRGSDARMKRLEQSMEIFFRDIYPRFFRYEPRAHFRVVYFSNAGAFERKTGMATYGYYSPADRSLYTYMGSGHGTLWHELIHAYVDENTARETPQWFNEGLGSFYEMGSIRSGSFSEGYANWRLPALQNSIRAGRVLPLREALLHSEFSPRFDYAEARFLFCWLWTQNQMDPFVRSFLYELMPRYRGIELGRRAIMKLEQLTGLDIERIDREYKALALRVKKNQKLRRIPREATPHNR